MKSKKRFQKRLSLTISLALFVFAVMLGALLLGGSIILVLYKLGVLTFPFQEDKRAGGP